MTQASKGTLAEALVAAQAEMPAVEPDAVNPHFKSRFVSLDNLIAKTRPVLNRHGLALTQWPSMTVNGLPALTTTLTHTSGESVESTMPLILGKNDMQGLGGAVTYARRYAWAAALGIAAEEDDDGNQASQKPAAKPAAASQSGSASAPPDAPKPTNANAEQAITAMQTVQQQKKLDRLIVNLSKADPSHDWAEVAEKWAQKTHGVPRAKLAVAQIDELVAKLNEQLEKAAAVTA